MRVISQILIILGVLVTSNYALAVDHSPARCIGTICVKQPGRTSSWLVRRYGKGKIQTIQDDARTQVHCFYDPTQRLWVEFEFSAGLHGKGHERLIGIFVTAIPMCLESFTPTKPFPRLTSEHNIAIGDAEATIIQEMGPPNRRDDTRSLEQKSPRLAQDTRYASRFGDRRLVYDDSPSSLLFNFYGIQDGKLLSIWLASTE